MTILIIKALRTTENLGKQSVEDRMILHFLEELIYSPLLRHGPHRELRLQQFSYWYMRISFYGNVFTEPLRSN
jgi:hypothetical protein